MNSFYKFHGQQEYLIYLTLKDFEKIKVIRNMVQIFELN